MRIGIVLCVLTFSVSVYASDKARGDAAMESGHYAEALSVYQAAYHEAPSAVLLYNMGRAEERLGRYEDAYAHLSLFAKTAPPEVRAKVPRLEELLADVRSHLPNKAAAHTVIVAATPPAARPPADSPPSEPITKKWWFWTGVGAVALGGTALAVTLLTTKDAPRGDIAPGQVSAPLLRF